jgi:hypothetical protein
MCSVRTQVRFFYFELLIRTMSPISFPRVKANDLPSRDQSYE